MKLLPLLLLLSCSQPDRNKVAEPTTFNFEALGGSYCCDTVKTLNHTAIVKSIIDTAGNLTGFEIVKVLK